MPAYRLDVFGPRIDQRDVVPGASEMAAEISADCAGTDDCDTFLHVVSPISLVPHPLRCFTLRLQRVALRVEDMRRRKVDAK